MCKQCGIDYDDLEVMTIGMCLDYINEYIEQNKPEKEKTRRAKQSDFDSF
ncbi:hypothetical protein [Aquibacillus kalidii]|nr:hypothetical protein [Aquibacillus kalidii]